MSVALDALMTAGNDPGTLGGAAGMNAYTPAAAQALSTNGMTVGPNATLLIVELAVTGANAASNPAMSWGGTSMGAPVAYRVFNNGTTHQMLAIFALANPAAGALALAATWTGSDGAYLGAVSFLGTDTTTPIVAADSVVGNDTLTGAHSVAINTAAGDATIVLLGNTGGGYPSIANQTVIFDSQSLPFAGNAGASYALGGSGSNTHTFGGGATAVNTCWAGIHIAAASGSGLPEPPPPGYQYTTATTATIPVPPALSLMDDSVPAVAVGDVFITPVATSLGFALTVNGDGTFIIAAGGSVARQSFTRSIWRLATNSIDGPATIWVNAFPPLWGNPISLSLPANVQMSPLNLASATYARSPSGDVLDGFTVSSGSLPPGISVSDAGLLTGTPTTPGTYTFTISALDTLDLSGTSQTSQIIITGGAATGTVPNIIGDTSAAAQAAIVGAGFHVGTITSAASTAAQLGLVVSQSPVHAPGVLLTTPVSFVLGSGPIIPNPPNVLVPNVVGLTQAQAQSALATVGLAVGSGNSLYE
jgi:hypothetical protein